MCGKKIWVTTTTIWMSLTLLEITKSNYKLIAAKLYRNPRINDDEFDEDLSLIRKISKKVEKFEETGEFPTRLMVNNIIIASNCFGQDFVARLLFLLAAPKEYSCIFTLLDQTLGISQGHILVNKGLIIRVSELDHDLGMLNKLKEEL